MCAHNDAEAQAAKKQIADYINPQLEQLGIDVSKLFALSDFYHCEAQKFDVLSGFSSQWNINGKPIDGGDFSKYSGELNTASMNCEEYAEYLDNSIKSILMDYLTDAQEKEKLAGTDCWACIWASYQSSTSKKTN